MFTIKRYTPDDAAAWDCFVDDSKNGTFLFRRDYMDYHADRFDDYSLIIRKDKQIYALLPACDDNNGTFWSHRGLTYGGLILSSTATAAATVEMIHEINEWLQKAGFHSVVYKAIPWIYHRLPSEEDIYAIFRECKAELIGRDISSAIVMDSQLKWSTLRRRGVNKALRNNVSINCNNDFEAFWDVLDNNLINKYGVHPVHTINEIKLLASRFPKNIMLYTAQKAGNIIGGTVLYITNQVVHVQYISASSEGKQTGAIDAIFYRIIHNDFAGYRYFDFGKSTEDYGHMLNETLIYQKEGFGGRGVCYDTYRWKL